MLRAKYALLALLLIVFAGCAKTNQEAAQQPAEQQATASPEAQQQAAPPQTPAPESSKSSSAAQKPVSARASQRGSSPTAGTTAQAVTSAESKASGTAAAPRAAEPRFATIPSGTNIQVRLQDALDSGVNQTGDTFSAILDKDVEVDGNVVIPRGSVFEGKLSKVVRSGRVEGRAQMSLQLINLTIANQTYPVQTDVLAFEAESTKKKDAAKVGVGAGIGAIIGAIAGGGKGAAIGAAVGAGAGGATVVATRGKELRFEAEHQLSFALRSGLKVKLQ